MDSQDFIQPIRDFAARGTGLITQPLEALSNLGDSIYRGVQRMQAPQTGLEWLKQRFAQTPQLPTDQPTLEQLMKGKGPIAGLKKAKPKEKD